MFRKMFYGNNLWAVSLMRAHLLGAIYAFYLSYIVHLFIEAVLDLCDMCLA